tara:strand:+ start:317 stop:559 length:243 start_codon:yes stop_codon:yes gene_type:complete
MIKKIFEFIKQKMIKSSSGLALTYTLGHILIAMMCTYFITGTALELAALNALIEPCINGLWFYALHKIFRYYFSAEIKPG